MQLTRMVYPFLLAGLLVAIAVSTVFAQDIVIDGNFDDWLGKESAVDYGGPDDEQKPSRADINEFRAHADSKGLYVLKTWDDTFFIKGQEVTAGITLQAPNKEYYRIYTTAQGKQGFVPLSSLNIKVCADPSCKEQKDICTGAECRDAQAGSGTTWIDPFVDIRRQVPDCSGEGCGKYDTAVELFIPWGLVGGEPSVGETLFLNFGSYPEGPASAPKDDVVYGIACQNVGNAWKCFLTKPTAVTLSSFHARTESDNLPVFVGVVILAFVAIGFSIGLYKTAR
ncbi:MAG: hypothetical protein N2559_05485 [Anaerolineae bacterium]|nr:hypothetical protein [Anaerolineae bacterium]